MRLTCREASRLISQGLDRRLTLPQRATLRLHLTFCAACTRVQSQFEFIRRALSKYSGGDGDDTRKPPR